jgi:dimethylargininase
MAGFSYRFSHAIVRIPGASAVEGLRAEDRGAPDMATFRGEHAGYVAALARAGLEVAALPPLEAYPDSVFVEDVALCLPEGAILLKPGAASRAGEVGEIRAALAERFPKVATVEEGSVDGGDILLTEAGALVGLSARTDRTGFDALDKLLRDFGRQARAVETPDDVLHFKTDCSLLDAETILATHRLCGAACFRDFRVLEVPEGEDAAANAIRVNDTVLIAAGFPRTAELLDASGYAVTQVPVGQAALLDGGLSCMSLRYRPIP